MTRPPSTCLGATGDRLPAAEVLARFCARRSTPAPVTCDECGDTVTAGAACPTCRQAAGPAPVGILAVAHVTAGGERRIVVAERTAAGGWAPLRSFAADARAERMLRRQQRQAEGGQPVALGSSASAAVPELFRGVR